ncbi:MAG: DUF4124 domain-containing protein [Candidatus Omnitrophota bacterium]
MRRIGIILTVAFFLVGAGAAAAKIYKYSHDQGVMHYSDKPISRRSVQGADIQKRNDLPRQG